MSDAALGGIGLGLVWGWWLVMAASPIRAHIWRAAVVLVSSSVVLVAGTYLLAGTSALVALVVSAASASTIDLLFRGALRARSRAGA